MKTIFYFFVISIFIVSCFGETADDLNKNYVALDQKISKGEIPSFESAKNQLDSLKRQCETQIAEIGFKDDEKSIKERTNLNTVLEKINQRTTALLNEQSEYEKVFSAGKESFETIASCTNYLKQYPDGLKRTEVEMEYNGILGNFMDDVAGQFKTHLTGLSETNTQSSMFQLANYTGQKLGTETVEYNEEDYETAMANFSNSKAKIIQVLDNVTVEIQTAKGNSPRSLKKLFEDYDNKLTEMRSKREAMISSLVKDEFENGGWEQRARDEIVNYIALNRRSFINNCNAYEISNDIQRAEQDKMTTYSNKIEIFMHYNINSYCSASGKYKYYDATFKLVFPIIENQLGTGYFDVKNIYQK